MQAITCNSGKSHKFLVGLKCIFRENVSLSTNSAKNSRAQKSSRTGERCMIWCHLPLLIALAMSFTEKRNFFVAWILNLKTFEFNTLCKSMEHFETYTCAFFRWETGKKVAKRAKYIYSQPDNYVCKQSLKLQGHYNKILTKGGPETAQKWGARCLV